MVLNSVRGQACIKQERAVAFQGGGRYLVHSQVELAEIRQQACGNMLVALEGGGCHLGALARHPAADDLVERYLTDFGHSPAGLAGAAVVVRLQLN